jgi:hypothetical protein
LRPRAAAATSDAAVNEVAPQGRAMGAEVQKIVDEIKQSVGLLRRHL